MKNSPFASKYFRNIWLKYFKPGNRVFSFRSIKHIHFYKSKYWPLYINVGRNITNGMYYEIDGKELDFKGKTFLVYDVPEYLKVNFDNISSIKIRKARQYKGFAANMSDFESFDEYFNWKYKSKTRYNYRKNKKRLEATFNISYKLYYGSISDEGYEIIFNSLINTIKRRFDSLGLDNNIVSKRDY